MLQKAVRLYIIYKSKSLVALFLMPFCGPISQFKTPIHYNVISFYYNLSTLGERRLTEEAICDMFLGAEIQKPDWVRIAKEIGFHLHGPTTSTTFLEEWQRLAHNSTPSWENLAYALSKMGVKKSKVGKIRDKTGMVMLKCL